MGKIREELWPWQQQPTTWLDFKPPFKENLSSSIYQSPSFGANFANGRFGPLFKGSKAVGLQATVTGGTVAAGPFGIGLRPFPGVTTGGFCVAPFGMARSGDYPAYQSSPLYFTAGIEYSLDSLTMATNEPQVICGSTNGYTSATFALLYRVPTTWGGPQLYLRNGDSSIGFTPSEIPEMLQVNKKMTIYYGHTGTRLWCMCNGVLKSVSSTSSPAWLDNGSFYMLGGCRSRNNTETPLRGVIYAHFVAVNVATDPLAFLPYATNFFGMFPQQIYLPFGSAAASSLPALSDLITVPGSITSTGWRARMTATY